MKKMYNNPYYQNYQNRFQPMGVPSTQPYIQPMAQPIPPNTNIGLQGKTVESIDVVKAMDIPLDGTISYFPLTDGSAIISKQLQADGTSKTTIYRPINDENIELPKYATLDDIKKEIEKIDLSEIDDLKEEIRDLKKDLKNLKKKGD